MTDGLGLLNINTMIQIVIHIRYKTGVIFQPIIKCMTKRLVQKILKGNHFVEKFIPKIE